MARGQAERLMPLLEEVLAEGNAAWDQLDALAVGVGPGNFTGIRISVSAARGLAMSLGIPAIGITLFDVQGMGYFDHPESSDDALVCLLAPRDQIYVQLWHRDGTKDAPRLVGPDAGELSPEERDATAIGEACERLKGMPKIDRRWNSSRRSTSRMTMLAQEHLDSARPLAPPTPLYIRPADAAPPRDAPPKILP